jgi:hypothetical protein
MRFPAATGFSPTYMSPVVNTARARNGAVLDLQPLLSLEMHPAQRVLSHSVKLALRALLVVRRAARHSLSHTYMMKAKPSHHIIGAFRFAPAAGLAPRKLRFEWR